MQNSSRFANVSIFVFITVSEYVLYFSKMRHHQSLASSQKVNLASGLAASSYCLQGTGHQQLTRRARRIQQGQHSCTFCIPSTLQVCWTSSGVMASTAERRVDCLCLPLLMPMVTCRCGQCTEWNQLEPQNAIFLRYSQRRTQDHWLCPSTGRL